MNIVSKVPLATAISAIKPNSQGGNFKALAATTASNGLVDLPLIGVQRDAGRKPNQNTHQIRHVQRAKQGCQKALVRLLTLFSNIGRCLKTVTGTVGNDCRPKVAVAGLTPDGNCITRAAPPAPLDHNMAPATITITKGYFHHRHQHVALD